MPISIWLRGPSLLHRWLLIHLCNGAKMTKEVISGNDRSRWRHVPDLKIFPLVRYNLDACNVHLLVPAVRLEPQNATEPTIANKDASTNPSMRWIIVTIRCEQHRSSANFWKGIHLFVSTLSGPVCSRRSVHVKANFSQTSVKRTLINAEDAVKLLSNGYSTRRRLKQMNLTRRWSLFIRSQGETRLSLNSIATLIDRESS